MKSIFVAILCFSSSVLLGSDAEESKGAFTGRWYSKPVYSRLYDGDTFIQFEFFENGTAFLRVFGTETSDGKKVIYTAMEVPGTYNKISQGLKVHFREIESDTILHKDSNGCFVSQSASEGVSSGTYFPENQAPWTLETRK